MKMGVLKRKANAMVMMMMGESGGKWKEGVA